MPQPKPDYEQEQEEEYYRDEFYEAMPQAFSSRFHPDPLSEERIDEEPKEEQHAKDQRLTAIITIVLTVVVAFAMGLLFLRGLDSIKSVTPPQATSQSATSY